MMIFALLQSLALALSPLPQCAERDAACIERRAEVREVRAAELETAAKAERTDGEAKAVVLETQAATVRTDSQKLASGYETDAVFERAQALDDIKIATDLRNPKGWVLASTVTPVETKFPLKDIIRPSSWGIPRTVKWPEPGAFRVACTWAKFGKFDPIVYFGQIEAGHVHDISGNVGVNGSSTHETLIAETRPSTCGGLGNQSPYWKPALMDDETPLKPIIENNYYKRSGLNDPGCKPPIAARCSDMPEGLKMVAGYDMQSMSNPRPKHWWYCIRNNQLVGTKERSLTKPAAMCQQKGDLLYVSVAFPDCWNGKHIDAPDHRSHLAWRATDSHTSPCPPTHPVAFPALTLIAGYDVVGKTNLRLSSDIMDGHEAEPGTSMHGDVIVVWDKRAKDRWTKNCLDTPRDCSGGQLGDGTALKQ